MSRPKELWSLNALGIILIALGYLIPPPRWINFSSIPPASRLPSEFLALSISLVFFLAIIGGYAITSTTEGTMKRAAITASIALIGSLITAILSGEINSLSFEVAKSVTLSAGVLLGGFLRVPQSLPSLDPTKERYLSGTELHMYMEKRIESSHSYRRNIIDNLIRWYTVFILVNYASMGWFAKDGEGGQGLFVVLVAAMFITQNGLGIMACLRVKRYLLASSYQIAKYEQALVGVFEDEEQEAFIPSRVYGRAIQLMTAGLFFIAVVWVALSLAIGFKSGSF